MFFKTLVFTIVMTFWLYSKGVPAGTQIVNIASLTYEMEGQTYSVLSNRLIDTVDQLSDIKLSCMESSEKRVYKGAKAVSFRFLLSNEGNGEDSFELSTLGAGDLSFNALNTKIYLDNGNDLLDSQDQPLYQITLQSDERRTIFLVGDIAQNATGSSKSGIEALSLIQMTPNRANDTNRSIVVATQKGENISYCDYQVASIWLELLKSVSPQTNLKSGDRLTYTIEAKVLGEGRLSNVVISDTIPKGTRYEADSLRLNGIKVEGFDNNAITVVLGEITQTPEQKVTHTIEFDVTIN